MKDILKLVKENMQKEIFLGISIPDQRKIVSKYYSLSLSNIEKLLAVRFMSIECVLFSFS